jgi:hypothetical protein
MATANLTQPTSAANGNIPFIGTTANDTTGSPLRTAFDRINDRLIEIYGSQDGSNVVQTPFIDGDNVKDDTINSQHYAAGSIDEEHLSVTNSPVDGYVLTYDSGTQGFTWEQKFDGDITGIVAGNGLTGDAASGEASLAVGAGTGITVNANDVQISDNGVDHDQLAARYTDKQDIATTTGTIDLDASLYSIFELTGNLGTATLNIENIKKGTVIDIILSGSDLSSAVITLSDDFTTSAINKIGSTDLDTSGTNLIQVVCLDDNDSDAILNYAIATYTTDTTP